MSRSLFLNRFVLLLPLLGLLCLVAQSHAQVNPPPPNPRGPLPPGCFTGQIDFRVDPACQGRGATGYMCGLQMLTDRMGISGDKLIYNIQWEDGVGTGQAIDFKWAMTVLNNNGGPPVSDWIWQNLTPEQRNKLRELWNAHKKIMREAVKLQEAKKKKDDCEEELAKLKAAMDAAAAAAKTAQDAATEAANKAKSLADQAKSAQSTADAYQKQWETGVNEVLPSWKAEFGEGSNEYSQAKSNVALQLERSQYHQERADDLKSKAEQAQKDADTAAGDVPGKNKAAKDATDAYNAKAEECGKLQAALDQAQEDFDKARDENPDAEDWDKVKGGAGAAAGQNARDKERERQRQEAEREEAERRAQAQAEEDRIKAQEEAKKRQQAKDEADLNKFLEFVEHVRKHEGDSAADSLLDPWGNLAQDGAFALLSAFGDGAKAAATGSNTSAAAVSSLAASGLTMGYAFLVNYAGSKIQAATSTLLLKNIAVMANNMMGKGQTSAIIKGEEPGQTQMTYVYKHADGSITAFHYSKSSGLVKARLTAHEITQMGGA